MHDRKTAGEKAGRQAGEDTGRNAGGLAGGKARPERRGDATPPAMRRRLHAAGALALMAGALAAQAQESGMAGDGQPGMFAVTAAPLPLPAAVRALPAVARASGAGDALGDARLENLRGGTETPWSDMRLDGTVGNNAATNVVTGANTITDGAFANASGLPMVIQNSGANVLIQNATIVNVQVR